MSVYQPPLVKEVFNKEFAMDIAKEVFYYSLKDAFLINNYYNYLDISFFKILVAILFIYYYYIKCFYSNNILINYIYFIYFKKL